MAGNAGKLLNQQHLVGGDLAARPPIDDDAGVGNAERRSGLSRPAKLFNQRFNEVGLFAHASLLSRCVKGLQALTC
jgi:hypothetical protein